MNYNNCKINNRGYLNSLQPYEMEKMLHGVTLPYVDGKVLNEMLKPIIESEDFLRRYFKKLTENMDRPSQVAFENLIARIESIKNHTRQEILWLKILREIKSDLALMKMIAEEPTESL